MRFNVSLLRFLCFSLFLTFSGIAARAQTNNGAIAGSILDSSGGAVADAQVQATGIETHSVYTTVSTATGAYRFSDLVLGHYDITVTAKGFKISTLTGVEVQINSTVSLDIALQPGDVKETVTVLADSPTIETGTSEMGTVIGSREIEELPLSLSATGQSFLRSPETFVFLAPGTQGPGTNQAGNVSAGIFQSKLTGGQNFGTEVLLDGVSTTRSDSGSAFDQTAPSVEALSEFKVVTSTFTAEYGRTSGGIESFATKSGTNDYHGTAFDLFRNTALDANSWNNNFNLAQCTTASCIAINQRPPDHQNDFGGSLGGPVRIPKLYDGRQKTFFFFSWEQYRNNPGTTSVTTLPTQTEIENGNFSALLGPPLMSNGQPVINPCDGTPVLVGQIFNPATTSCPTGFVGGRIAFPGNIIPTGDFDPVAKKILSYLTVLPNLPGGDNGLVSNFVFASSEQERDTTMSFRIDQNWGTKNKFFFSYSSRDQGTPNGANDLPGPLNSNFFNINFTHYLRGGWDYTISPTLLNTFTVGFNRLNNLSKADSVNGTDWPSVLGIGNANGAVFPQISFGGSPLGIGYQGFSTESYNGHVPNSLVTADNVRWIKGRHSFDFGFEWRAYQYSFIATGDTSPNYGFSNFQTAYAPNDPSTGDPFASFLLGLPDQEQLTETLANPRLSSYYYAAYVQDDFKVRRDLTLNLGLRYDVDTPRHEDHGDQSSLNLNIPNPGAPGENGALVYGSMSNQGLTYFGDVGPRVGFAYAPTELFGHIRNIVVRGGYAIYYAALFYDDLPTGTIQFSNGNVVEPTFTSLDNYTPVQALSAGFPNFAPPVNSTDPSRLNGTNVGYIAPSYGRPGMTQNWSLEVQKQLAQDLILSLGYVGVDGSRLHTNIAQVNALNPKYYDLGNALTDSVTSPAGEAVLSGLGVAVPSWFVPLYGSNALVGQLLRPYPQYLDIGGSNNGMCSCLENLGISTYNAFQAKLERRFRNGLNLLASYTFSKTLTNADSAIPVFSGFSSGEFASQDPFNPKTQKSYSYQDTPHMLVLSYIYELPAGQGKKYLDHGVASKVLGGWQIGGVQRYQSGTPTVLGTNAPSAPFTDGSFRYSLVPGQPLLAPNHGSFNPFGANSGCTEQANGTFIANSTNNYFNCAAFMDPNAPELVAQRGYVYGDAPLILGNVRSQPYFNEDFAILKRTAINEKQSLIFKVDIPNAFNRHVFGTRDGGLTDSTFGVSGGSSYNVVSPVRKIQLTLRYQF
jgi:Carboxypeptidase regulatory-like domain